MSQDELMELVHRAAREELAEILESVLLVRLPEGREKSAVELTEGEFASLEPPEKQLWRWWWIHRHRKAEQGQIHVGRGEFKAVDRLTLEDVPRLLAERKKQERLEEAALKVVDFIAEGLQDLESMGIEADWEDDETLGDWLRKDPDRSPGPDRGAG